MNYQLFARIVLADEYHEDGRCLHVSLVPTSACRRLLKQLKLSFKKDVAGASLIAEVSDVDTPVVATPPGLELTFYLRVDDLDFVQITDHGAAGELGPAIFSNAGLDPDVRELALVEGSLRATDGCYGLVVLTELSAAWLTDPPVFRISFKSRAPRWVYYLITDVGEHRGAIDIVDADVDATPVVFGEAGRRELNLEEDPNDRLAVILRDQYPDHRRLRFISDDHVAHTHRARTNIELRLAGDMVAGPLPNPSLSNFSTVEVTANSETQREASLFQIIKHLTHSL